jgi:hypothetical protein
MRKVDLLRDLEKWPAGSHPALANRKPDQLFEPIFVERYKRLHEDLWRRMINLNGTLSTLEQLADFPFGYVYGPGEMEFWRLVAINFFNSTIVLLHALVKDRGSDVHTLPAFCKQITEGPWISEEMKKLFEQTFQERQFDATVESIAHRVRLIRHHRIAHRLIDKTSAGPKEVLADVSLSELRQLYSAAEKLFAALSFGSHCITLAGDLIPTTIGGQPTRTCLDGVLDAIVRADNLVNEPERRGELWAYHRNFIPAEELRVMNELRKRIGLPAA